MWSTYFESRSDAAKSSTDATGYFDYLRKLFTLFSVSTQRLSILKWDVNLNFKSWSYARWKCQVSSVETVWCQSAEVSRVTLIEVRDKALDPKIMTEVQSFGEEVWSYHFSVCTVVWYNILTQIQHVCKLLQSPSMQMYVAAELLKKTEASLVRCRATGFVSAQVSAKDICKKINVEAVLKQKRLKINRQFFCESSDEEVSGSPKKMEISFFNVVLCCVTVRKFSDIG